MGVSSPTTNLRKVPSPFNRSSEEELAKPGGERKRALLREEVSPDNSSYKGRIWDYLNIFV